VLPDSVAPVAADVGSYKMIGTKGRDSPTLKRAGGGEWGRLYPSPRREADSQSRTSNSLKFCK